MTEKMTREQVWGELVKRGASRATVHYSGGNDSGGADDIRLWAGDKELCSIEEHHGWRWIDGKAVEVEPDEDGALADALAAPVYDAYGSFAGDFSTEGVVTWDVATRTARMTGQDTIDQYEDVDRGC
jgi:hypothetical protein